MALTNEERKIIISKDGNALRQLKKEVDEANDAFLKLKLSGSATSKELQEAGANAVRLGAEFRRAKDDISRFGNEADIATGKLGKGLKATTKFITSAFGATVQLAGGIQALSGELGNQDSVLQKVSDKVTSYGIALIGVGSAISNLKYLVPVLNAGFLATAGIMSTLTIGVTAVASAYGLMAYNISRAIEAFKEGGIIGLLTKTAFSTSPETGEPLKIKSLDERVKEVTDRVIPTIGITSDGAPPTGSRGIRTGSNIEKQINYLSERFIGLSLYNLQKEVSGVLPESMANITAKVGTIEGTSTRSSISSVQSGVDAIALRDVLLQTLSDAGENLSTIVNTFGIKTETVLGQAVEKFSMILSLIQNTLTLISNINSGISIVKSLIGIASGGTVPLVNAGSSVTGGSNYFKIDLNTMEIVKDGFPKYQEYKGAIAVS